ncbi:MAG: hypothetical protein AAFQ84_05460 [Pseudomonadota bacterium]
MNWSFRPDMFSIRTPYDVYSDALDAWQRVAMASLNVFTAQAAAWRAMMASPLNQMTVNYPFSGDVTQHIAPETSVDLLARAGDADVERAIVESVASYGRQLGWIIDYLDDLARQSPGLVSGEKVEQIRDLKSRIEAAKRAVKSKAET